MTPERWQRWDNPVPMRCGSSVPYGAASRDHFGATDRACSRDAAWVLIGADDLAIGWACHEHYEHYRVRALIARREGK